MRLVIDDSAVSDAELGRKSGKRTVVVLGIGLALGLAVGYGGGSTAKENQVYNQVVRDGSEIYKKIQEASGTVDQAKKHVKTALEAATPTPGKEVKVEYSAIEALRSLPKPIDAGVFARRWYKAFQPSTVDDLFEYNTNVQTLWNKFASIAATSLPEGKRKLLDESAQAATNFAQYQYGMVPTTQNDQFIGGLVYITGIEEGAADKSGRSGPTTAQVAQRPGTRTVEKLLYGGQTDFGANPDKYVVMLDKGRSAGILGESANAFAQYRAELAELNALLGKTVEQQGRLLTELGKVAALEERFSF